MTTGTRRIPDALLERYLTDSLQAEARTRLEATLERSPKDQQRLAELRADSAAVLLQHPSRTIVERLQKKRWRSGGWMWLALLVPAFAATAVWLVRPLPSSPYTAKGSVILTLFYVASDGSFVPVSPDVPLAPETSLHFKVRAAASGFVAVLSRNAQGVVSVYHPYDGKEAVPFDALQPRLPVEIILDGTLGREDVYALYSTQPFELGWAMEALKRDLPLKDAAPKGVYVDHVSFTKQK
ncbi:MFS transporter [Hyalangium gracile]|uniref:hypothetical protein n=1 Tax=Hyalangium gracile TaxID=394092 RepID=UPI001CCA90A7|nr:hypothetical protein [Hyalangium gracile]